MTVANLKDLDLSALRDMKMLRRWVFWPFGSILTLSEAKAAPDSELILADGDPHWALALLQAVDDMNGKELNGRQVYVGRAQKKGERQNELKRKFEQMKQDRMTRYQVNRILFWKLNVSGPCMFKTNLWWLIFDIDIS